MEEIFGFFAQRRYIWHIRNHTVLSSGVLSESNEFWLTSFFMLYHNVRQEQNAFVISFMAVFFFNVTDTDFTYFRCYQKKTETRGTTWEVLHIIYYYYLICGNNVFYYILVIIHKSEFVNFSVIIYRLYCIIYIYIS